MLACMTSALLAGAIMLFRGRPRGWARVDLLMVSTSPISGQGLFARADIAPGTVLGSYPGIPRSQSDMIAKAERAPGVAQFVFSTGELREGLWIEMAHGTHVFCPPAKVMGYISTQRRLTALHPVHIHGLGGLSQYRPSLPLQMNQSQVPVGQTAVCQLRRAWTVQRCSLWPPPS
jgi:hypothetical protein